jgi:HK97 family phage portal protein
MGLIAQLRTSLENPSTPLSYPAEWLLDIFNGGRTDSGIRVSEKTALQVTTIFACVQLISGAVGSPDLNVYERIFAENKRAGKRIAYEHSLFDLLENEPNDEMSSFTFRTTLQAHALLWGNLYAEIQRDNGNRILAIWPRNPSRTRPFRLMTDMVIQGERLPKGSLVYKTTERVILKEDMIHIPGLALDGRLGESVVNLARQAVGLALATEKFGAKVFGNGAVPGLTLSHPGKLQDKARENLKKSISEAYGGENVWRPMVLEEGLKVDRIGFEPDKAQALQTRQFQKGEICSIFLVPPHMVGDTEKTNRANTEQIGLEFVTFTMRRWYKAWEQELKRKCFPKTGQSAGKFFAMFDTRPLTMPDADSRRNFYSAGHQNTFLSANDTREMEHLNPIDEPWADGYWVQINMQNAETAWMDPGQGPGPADPSDPASEEPDKLGKRFVRAYSRLFRDAFNRVLVRSSADSGVFQRAFMPVFLSLAESFGELASQENEYDAAPHLRFLSDYIEGMQKRFDGWKSANGEADKAAERELGRAVKAISIEVYREVAAARAKAQLTAKPRPQLEEVLT